MVPNKIEMCRDGAADWKFDSRLPYKLYPSAQYETGLTVEKADELNKLAAANNASVPVSRRSQAFNDSQVAYRCIAGIENNTVAMLESEVEMCDLYSVDTTANSTLTDRLLAGVVKKRLADGYASGAYNYNPNRPCDVDVNSDFLRSGLPCDARTADSNFADGGLESVCLLADYVDAIHYDSPKVVEASYTGLYRTGAPCARKAEMRNIKRAVPVQANPLEAGSPTKGRQTKYGPARSGKVAFLTHDRYFVEQAQQDMLEEFLLELKRRRYSFSLMRHYHLAPHAKVDEQVRCGGHIDI